MSILMRKERRYALSIEIRELINDGLILPPATYRSPKTLVDTLNAEGSVTTKLVDNTVPFSKMQLYAFSRYPSEEIRKRSKNESIQTREDISDNGVCE